MVPPRAENDNDFLRGAASAASAHGIRRPVDRQARGIPPRRSAEADGSCHAQVLIS